MSLERLPIFHAEGYHYCIIKCYMSRRKSVFKQIQESTKLTLWPRDLVPFTSHAAMLSSDKAPLLAPELKYLDL